MTIDTGKRSRSAVAALIGVAVVLSIASSGGAAQAETCTNGTPMRTLTEEETGFVANQVCLQGEWVSVSRWQLKPDELVINEPRDTTYHLTAESFFDLKNYDPYAIITAFRDVIERGKKLSDTDMTDLLLKSARTDAQALLARSTRLNPRQNCQNRSQLDSDWNRPEPFSLVAGGPRVITYALDPSLSTAQRVVVFNAIAQYRPTVDAQDYVGNYPDDIVLDDPADPRPPTITFRSGTQAELAADYEGDAQNPVVLATTDPKHVRIELGKPTLISAEITLIDQPDQLHPGVVAHEIGHVLGIRHTPRDRNATMRPSVAPVNTISPWDVRNSHNDTPAFDACMFLPME
ncbi:hypothetical protein ACEXOS_013820 [Herbiconiux sp. P16]|uniref:hypothetical protein n=1 Tax=Herbiconiux wuyangfengii TaxID=3342794 RepID=UPI0035B78D03